LETENISTADDANHSCPISKKNNACLSGQ
jgi:hypothetical protein